MNLFERHHEPILRPRSDVSWASGAVFNPGVWYDGSVVHLAFRAVPSGYKTVMVVEEGDTEPRRGFVDYVSYIGYAASRNGTDFHWKPEPLIRPGGSFDRFGAEDPRICKIGELYLITYTALSHPAFGGPDGVRIGLASTYDFETVSLHGIVGPDVRDKDAVIFPTTFDGRVAMLHRIFPNVQLAWFENVGELCNPPENYWPSYLDRLEQHVVMWPEQEWEEKKIGMGPTPIETPEGWLVIYHGVDRHHVYRMGLALLDLENPSRIIARTVQPVMEPETDYERIGDVNNVVFPEGAAVIDGVLHVYYGAADKVIGLATAPLSDVLAAVKQEV